MLWEKKATLSSLSEVGDNMVIGLFGYSFEHENMGCQALTASFLTIIKKCVEKSKVLQMDPDGIEIINFSSEKSFGKIADYFPEFKFTLAEVSLKKNPIGFKRKLSRCDIIFDATYGDGFSDIYFTKSVYKNILVKMMCGMAKAPFVLTPQTYGPFENKKLEKLAGKAIHLASTAYARDDISSVYAEKLSHRKVKSVTDVAFVLPYKKTKYDEKTLGLNISGLLWQGGFNGNTNQFGLKTDYQTYIREVIKYAEEEGYKVHLIPHVTKSGDADWIVPDGDYQVCEELNREFPDTVLAPCFESPYEAKNYISSMDIFIGARMHATIAAFSSGVATIPFAYSRKFKGLYNKLGYAYIIDGTEMDTESALAHTREMIGHSDRLIISEKMAMGAVKEKINDFAKEIMLLLERVVKF